MMGNRVQSFSHEVSSVIVRWYIGKRIRLANKMFCCEMAANDDVLSTRIVDWVVCNVDASGIIYHNRYEDCITELCESVEVPDW